MSHEHVALTRPKPLAVRTIAFVLAMVVGFFSIEVIWERDEGTVLQVTSAVAVDSETDAGPDDGCPCFCACSCEAVHVVLPAPQAPVLQCDVPAFAGYPIGAAPAGRSVEPPFRPPRRLS